MNILIKIIIKKPNEKKKMMDKSNIHKLIYTNRKREVEGITRDFIDRQEKYYSKGNSI